MPSTPLDEIMRRITGLQSAMAEAELAGALMVQRADVFYFSGTGQDAHLFVPVEGAPVLLVRKSFERAVEDSPLEQVHSVTSLSLLKSIVESASAVPLSRLGMELDILPVNNFRLYESLFPDAAIVDVSPLVKQVRVIKSAYELDFILQAARLNDMMYGKVPAMMREGMPEVELAGLIEAFYRKHGHQGFVRVRSFNSEVFYGHIMSGVNLAVPSCSVGPTGGPGINASLPQGVGTKAIGKHEPVQIDYVAVINGYMVDQARTFYIGEPPEKLAKVHETALAVQNRLAEMGKAGTPAELLYDTAMEMAEKAGLPEGFLGYPQAVPFVGHGVGLELDEWPVIGKKSPHILQEGMVVALEPKFIVPGEGLGGIENTFLVTSEKMEKLTKFDDAIYVV
jgi:Xaa-Pro dipeptidase